MARHAGSSMAELDRTWLEELRATFESECAAIQEALDEMRITMPNLADYIAEHIVVDSHRMTIRYTGSLGIAVEEMQRKSKPEA